MLYKIGRLLLVVLVVFAFMLPCDAAQEAVNTDLAEILPKEEWAAFIEALPSDLAKLLPCGVLEGGIDDGSSGASEALEPSFLISLIRVFLELGLKEAAPSVLSLFSVLLLCALLVNLKNTIGSPSLSGAAELAVTVVTVSLTVRAVSSHVVLITDYLGRLSELCLSMLPFMGAILASGGSGGAAVANHGGFMMVLGVMEAVVGQAFGGIVGMSIALVAANSLSGSFRLGAVARAVRRCFGIFFGAVMSLLGFVISLKIGIAAAADSLAMRGVKMFASNAIPIVGSAMGDSLRTLASALSYMKSVGGTVAIVLVVVLTLPTLITVWLYRCGLVLLSGAAEMLGCDRQKELFGGIVSVYGYMLAVVAVCSSLFLLLLTLFMKTTLAFGGGI